MFKTPVETHAEKIGRLTAKTVRLQNALRIIENHELRDHEDYDAIKEIAREALLIND